TFDNVHRGIAHGTTACLRRRLSGEAPGLLRPVQSISVVRGYRGAGGPEIDQFGSGIPVPPESGTLHRNRSPAAAPRAAVLRAAAHGEPDRCRAAERGLR